MRFGVVVAGLVMGIGLGRPASGQSLDWTAMAGQLIEQMRLAPGERVLLLGRADQFAEFVPIMRQAVREAGGTDLGALASSGPSFPDATGFVRQVMAAGPSRLTDLLETVDVTVILPGATSSDLPYATLQGVLRRGRNRAIHFHWAGAYDLNGNLLSNTPAIDSVYLHALLETDYAALGVRQRAFESAARSARIRVTTPLGTEISFSIGDRPMTKQDGDASRARATIAQNLIDREVELPAGAIRVAPMEESVEGVIAFPDGTWSGRAVTGLRMHVTRGRVTRIEADTGRDAVEAELRAAGDVGRAFREFALGFNPLLAIPEDGSWIPYYGYGAGVVRLSLGNNAELGGAATGGGYVRWNFFTDATVYVGRDVWVRDGRFVR